MPTIDAQVHCYERDHPGRPWVERLTGPPEVTGADMVKAMDDVGVDGAVLVSVWTMYRYDDSYALLMRVAKQEQSSGHGGHPTYYLDEDEQVSA